jgi:predicted CoA-binding protein
VIAPEPYADPEVIERVLRETRTWAVVGCSSNPLRPSHGVARTLMNHGYRMIPVNPREAEVHGQRAYADLFEAQADATEAGHPIEVVDIFRNSAFAGIHVDEAIEIGALAVWMQLNVIDEAAAERARQAGLWVVMDRCPAIELPRLSLDA